MDDDLMRLKTYIEKGKVPHDAAAKRRNDMKIEEIMTKNPKFCTDTMNLHEVAQMMNPKPAKQTKCERIRA